MPDDLVELTKLFARLGASEPELWASSQINEGISQLHRYVFLRLASHGVADESGEWIDAEIEDAAANPEAPFAGAGLAIARALALGVQRQDIVDLVRAMQARTLFDVCAVLDGSMTDSLVEKLVPTLGWSLVESENGVPTSRPIGGLHESVLETDPLGREMRPRA